MFVFKNDLRGTSFIIEQMSFGITKKQGKRLARRLVGDPAAPSTPTEPVELTIVPYTEKSIVVMGDTSSHINALGELGGKYTNLRIGMGWLFAKVREDSVREYIETGEVKPFVYSNEAKERFEKARAEESPPPDKVVAEETLYKLFRELRGAVDAEDDYEGGSILEVIHQLEERYLSKKAGGE
jgi:hypothetical protein